MAEGAANRLSGLSFRRQQIIDGFIADFYCHAASLVIELDGPVHDSQTDYDAERQRLFEGRGLRVLRFSNARLFTELEAVLCEISDAAQERVEDAPTDDERRPPLAPP